jgi:hypothetical protein
MTLYSDFDAIRAATGQRTTSVGAWTADRQLAALDFEDRDRQYRKELDDARTERVEQLQRQLFSSHLSRLHAGCPDEGDVLRMTHLPFSSEHETRIAAALRRGFRSFAFVQLRIALRMLSDDYHDQADSQTPEVTFEPRHVRLGDEKVHRTYRIVGEGC